MEQLDFLNFSSQNSSRKRKTLVALLVIFSSIIISQSSQAQRVFPVKYPSDADIKLFEVQNDDSADLVVFVTQDTTGTSGNTGIWIESQIPDNAKKIFFVSNSNDADIKIYVTDNMSNAGWLNTTKISLMN